MAGDITLERSLPHSEEAERAVLGAILVENSALNTALERLEAEDFYREGHKRIFRAFIQLSERGVALDPITLSEELSRQGSLEQVGGMAHLASLMDGVPVGLNVEHHAEIVKEKATLRALVSSANRVIHTALRESVSTPELLEEAQRSLFEISQGNLHGGFLPVGEILDGTMPYLERRETQLTGMATGYELLDEYTSGLQPGELIILAARPGLGKTSLALNIAQNLSTGEPRRTVGIFSLEMTREQLVMRLICSEARVDHHRLRRGYLSDPDWEKIMTALEKLSPAPIYIDDSPGITPLEMQAKSRRLKSERGLDLLIVDYIQLMHVKGFENRTLEIASISRALKGMSKELGIPVLAISQLSRAIESRSDERPRLSDLRESGCLAGDTLVALPETGARVPIRDLSGRSGFQILALNERSWQLEPAMVSRAFPTGTRPVFELRTRLGRSIRATANHRFRVFDGWKRLDGLKPGERIALPRIVRSSGRATMSEAHLALLGHLIGDGCTLPSHVIQYTTKEWELAEIVSRKSVEAFGDAVRPRIKRERSWLQVYLASTRHHTHGVRSAIAEWLDGLGVYGLRSWQKHLPRELFRQPAASIALFLKHLWATDGCVRFKPTRSGRRIPNVYYATSSGRLARDVQSLLLRLGINARLVMVPQGSKGRDQFHVILSGKPEITRFLETVGTVGRYRGESAAGVLRHFEGVVNNPNRDVIPAETWSSHVLPAMRVAGMTHREMMAAIQTAYCGSGLFRQNMSRARASRVAAAVGSAELDVLASSDVYWDEVAAVEPRGETDVYDLTVPSHQNFVANDLVVHNSLEQDSDVVMFINRKPPHLATQDERGVAEIIIAKQRNGPTGSFELAFLEPFTRFENLAVVEGP